MVTLQENKIVITIATPTPAETLAEMQAGIIGTLQEVFLAVPGGKTLEVESQSANGFYYLLQLLRESMFDPATIEAAAAVAEVMNSRAQEAA